MNHNLVECLIKREGPTIFHIGKIQYTFSPRPELTGDMEASVCVVINQEHRDYLLKDRMCAQYYRAYEPKQAIPEDAIQRAEFEAFQELRKTHSMEEIAAIVAQKTAPPKGRGQSAATD